MDRKVAFVTGASRGIGRASALALAEAGYDVVVTARTVKEGERVMPPRSRRDSESVPLPGSIETTAREVRERGREALPIRLDLLDLASIDGAIEQALAEWGRIDLLLNNGIYQGRGTMDWVQDLTQDDMHKIFQGNLFSQVHAIQKVLPHMLERGSGTLINVVSGSGLNDPPAPAGQGGWGFAYAASKAAFIRMAGVLRVELEGRGIRVYNLEPGFVLTEAARAAGRAKEFEAFGGATPEVPAAVVVWLATHPEEAEKWHGRTLFAQKFAADRGLVPS